MALSRSLDQNLIDPNAHRIPHNFQREDGHGTLHVHFDPSYSDAHNIASEKFHDVPQSMQHPILRMVLLLQQTFYHGFVALGRHRYHEEGLLQSSQYLHHLA